MGIGSESKRPMPEIHKVTVVDGVRRTPGAGA
jgi:hypothetical protein